MASGKYVNISLTMTPIFKCFVSSLVRLGNRRKEIQYNMRPTRWPYSRQITKTPSDLLEEWIKARKAFYASAEQGRIFALKQLNEATYRAEKVDHSIQQLGSRV